MLAGLRHTVEPWLSAPDDLAFRLAALDAAPLGDLAEYFAVQLPEFDLIAALPDTGPLGARLARLRGAALWEAGQAPLPRPERGHSHALVLTALLEGGEPEAGLVLQLREHGWRVGAVAATLHETNAAGGRQLAALGCPVTAGVQIAATPRGLILERRRQPR